MDIIAMYIPDDAFCENMHTFSWTRTYGWLAGSWRVLMSSFNRYYQSFPMFPVAPYYVQYMVVSVLLFWLFW